MRTLAFILVLAACAFAKNVDLVTLPNRDGVQLTIYNSADITLVKETRSVTLKRGSNQLQFSWAGTLIDPTSVEFRPLEHVDEIEVADTVFPGQKPQHLFWNIDSTFEGEVKVEVTYFTSGLTWTMDYVGITDPDESGTSGVMDFTGHVRVFNRSGEEYENANIRLIVGKINLVEQIARLAKQKGIAVPRPSSRVHKEMEERALRGAMDRAAGARIGRGGGAKKAIVKEGLSEYFMFSVAGTETIRNGWSKRMQSIEARGAKFEVLYRMRAHQYGPRPVRFFIWSNSDKHKLGDSPLPDGRVRLYRRNGNNGMSFLGEQRVRYVPIKAKIEINLGPDDLVTYQSRKADTERVAFRFRVSNRREFVDGWDEKTKWIDRVRNARGKPIRFELQRIWPGDIEFRSEIETTLFDYRTTKATFRVSERAYLDYPAEITQHHGRNRKQNSVKLK